MEAAANKDVLFREDCEEKNAAENLVAVWITERIVYIDVYSCLRLNVSYITRHKISFRYSILPPIAVNFSYVLFLSFIVLIIIIIIIIIFCYWGLGLF